MTEFESCMKCKYYTKLSVEFPCNSCKHGVSIEDFYKPKTNADAVREMTDKEMAEWLFNHDTKTEEKGRLNKKELLSWLDKEAEV